MKTDLTIVIGTHNRCQSLEKTLNKIFDSIHGDFFTFEILIVDNNSTDGTKEVVKRFQNRYAEQIKYVFEQRQGISYARNCGIREAGGDFLVFTDDDCL